MLLKTLHSRRTCLIVQGVWHVDHCGCCSCLRIKECVSLLWPIRKCVIVTCSFRDFQKAGGHCPKKGLTWNSLLLVFLFQRCCQFLWRKLFISGFRSVYGMLYLSGPSLKPILLLRLLYDFLSPNLIGLVWFVGFYGISTFVGYLKPNPFLCK